MNIEKLERQKWGSKWCPLLRFVECLRDLYRLVQNPIRTDAQSWCHLRLMPRMSQAFFVILPQRQPVSDVSWCQLSFWKKVSQMVSVAFDFLLIRRWFTTEASWGPEGDLKENRKSKWVFQFVDIFQRGFSERPGLWNPRHLQISTQDRWTHSWSRVRHIVLHCALHMVRTRGTRRRCTCGSFAESVKIWKGRWVCCFRTMQWQEPVATLKRLHLDVANSESTVATKRRLIVC